MLVDETPVEVKVEEQTNVVQPVLPEDPAGRAAMQLPLMIGYLKELVNDIGGVHAKKVLMTIAETPFQKEPVHFTTDKQYEAYNIALAIENAKFQIWLAGLREEMNKAKEEKLKENQNSELSEINKEGE